MKDGQFKPIKERCRKKCNDWCEKYMSSGAKEALIKSVVQAMPNYAMSIFKFSVSLCDELAQIIRNFWWGDEIDKKKTHWKAWEKIAVPKHFGGMGFRDPRLFNQALLARQAWRLIKYPESLCARLLKARYYPNGDLTDTSFSKNPSPGWQGIFHGLDLLKKGVIWIIHTGSKIRIWRDNWIPKGNLRPSPRPRGPRYRWVSDLINQNTMQWKEELVRATFQRQDVEEILRIRLPRCNGDDFLAWHFENSGDFSVRSAYKLALINDGDITTGQSSNRPNGDRHIWDVIWKAKVPQKVKIFTWRLATDALAVQTNRYSRKMITDPTCKICDTEAEDGYHATMQCTKARALRCGLRDDWDLPLDRDLQKSGADWTINILCSVKEDTKSKIMLLWWRAWHLRNDIIFGQGKAGINASAIFLSNYAQTLSLSGRVQHTRIARGRSLFLYFTYEMHHLTLTHNPATGNRLMLDGTLCVLMLVSLQTKILAPGEL
jgi:hypothetical protein